MQLSTLLKRIQSICGRYSQTKGTDAYSELLLSLNDSIQSVCHKFQPDALVDNAHFIAQYDGSSDVFRLRSFASVEQNQLKSLLANMTPKEIGSSLPTFTVEETKWRLSALIPKADYGNIGYGYYYGSMYAYDNCIYANGYAITYDEAYFDRITGNNISLVEDIKFARQINIKNEYMQSKYVRCVILENDSVVSDVVFQPYELKQSVNNGFRHILDLEAKTLSLYATSIGNYRARVFSVKYPTNSRVLLVKKDKLFCSSNISNVQSLYPQYVPANQISVLASFIPPVLIHENQTIPQKIYSDKNLMELIVYDTSFSYSNLFGMPDEAIAKQLDQYVDTYSSVKLQDASGGDNGIITRMY
ncbi:MAG: hypothetical protein ACRCX2_18510 [Paraclostridium sp.]